VSGPILLVDDEAEFTSILAKVLRRRGFAVEVASTGEAAIEALRERAFAVVVLDVKMPDMDGLHVLGSAKGNLRGAKVILLTGHLSPGEEEQRLADGVFAYLLKPYPTEQLVAVIGMAQRGETAGPTAGALASEPR
jgi:CheY-like chemotaxis protein